jgi:hypothetical protein
MTKYKEDNTDYSELKMALPVRSNSGEPVAVTGKVACDQFIVCSVENHNYAITQAPMVANGETKTFEQRVDLKAQAMANKQYQVCKEIVRGVFVPITLIEADDALDAAKLFHLAALDAEIDWNETLGELLKVGAVPLSSTLAWECWDEDAVDELTKNPKIILQ